MTSYKDFDQIIATRNAELGDGPEFTLGGTRFRTVAEPAATSVIDLVASDQKDNLSQMVDYVKTMVVPEQRELFLETAKRIELGISVLNELVSWLSEEYAGRPTKLPESSASGSSKTGAKSKAKDS